MKMSVSPRRIIFLGSVLLLLMNTGCGNRAAVATKSEAARAAVNPWPVALQALRKETDAASCRRILNQLNAGLAADPTVEQPAALSESTLAALAAVVPLSEAERREITPAIYSALDAHYLAQVFYFQDIARTLQGVERDPASQLHAAFAWVCRQVELRPWVRTELRTTPQGTTIPISFSPALPPEYVLRRGSGSGLERAYVFLALLQQLGYDGCLIGPPEALRQPAVQAYQGTGAPPRGPFWAVAARVDGDLLLFDPWRGQPFPSPDGTSVGTLAQIVAKPELLKPWREDAQQPWTVDNQQLTSAIPILAVPLSALAPRWQIVEAKLQSDSPIRLTVDAVAFQERFRQETKQPEAAFWNPPDDPFSYTRTLANFLPLEEGGWDDRPQQARLYERYQFDQLPQNLFNLPAGLAETGPEQVRYLDLIMRLRSAFASTFAEAFLSTPSPREQLQRGLYHDVTRRLVQNKERFEAMLQRVRTDRRREQQARRWIANAKKVYDDLSQARLDETSNPTAVAQAQQAVERFWSGDGSNLLPLIDAAVGEAGVAEATYLIALSMHEQAIRRQIRWQRALQEAGSGPDAVPLVAETARTHARDAWAEARDWWERYAAHAKTQESSFPGRAEHARRLAEEARQQLALLQ